MDSKPPLFDGDIDGVKLNSIFFQFESYFTFKSYDLALDGAIVGLPMCERKRCHLKMRTILLNIKQRGTYHGYAAKFQEQLRLVPLELTFAKEVFLKGVTSANLRKQTLRKNPETLEEAIPEGFC
ncbi:hypothetical protein L914_20418 [Phytophthora nicotianae]|uniref:Retrotransposon gag domain-containing protein n=1 Tax=Phytophthora nicotianae TaxID=4792 RepID=W2M725_PHYNI|nr:hypothetical protein L914_20418 [Phytophthora nicotianae]